MAFLNRFQGVLLAFLLMVLLAGRVESLFTTTNLHQIDFWAAWLICMVVLTFPILLLESALAKRTQTLPIQALPALTRDADASTKWRGVGWLAIAAMLLLAGVLNSQLTHYTAEIAQQNAASTTVLSVLPFAMIVLVAALSTCGKWLPLVGALGMAALAIFNVLQPAATASSWQITPFAFTEWSGAVALALAATGVGIGLYWQSALLGYSVKSRYPVLPIWIAQIVGGAVVAFGLVNFNATSELNVVLSGVALLSGAAVLLSFARQQLVARGLPRIVVWVVLFASLAIWILPIQTSLLTLAMISMIVVAAIYAIFSGWKMKSSHMRKALDFNNEALYNLWRVMVRLVVPLAVVIALIGLVEQYVVWIQ
jgi:hypothetical protein